MDIEKLKDVLTRAVMVVAYRAGDVSTEDGSYATTGTDEIIRLEQSLCDALGTEHDDIDLYEALSLIESLHDYKSERDEALAKLATLEGQEPVGKVAGTFAGAYSVGNVFFPDGVQLPNGTELYAKPIPADKPAPEHKGWYCAHCQCGVDPSEVTYNEAHTVCGRIITADDPPVIAEKPSRITEQDARDIINTYIDNKIGVPVNEWLTPLLNKLNADREQVPVVDAETHTSYCALNTINDDQVRKVVRAFWRRIYPYRNDYGIELPTPMPVEFMAHMATALTWVDNKSAPAVAIPYTEAIGDAGERYFRSFGQFAPRTPATFRWQNLWDAMLAAAPTHSQQSAEEHP